jgi:FOG: HEAT repeat
MSIDRESLKMTENTRILDETSAPEEVSKSEVTLASDIMLSMVKTSKGAKMYQANNPILGRFFQELVEKMSMMLNQYNEYKLDIDRFELRYKGHLVYENADTNESLAFRMYSDGIRSIIFTEGIEERELKEFLEIVSMSLSGSLDDDIVTRLWDKGLPHCSYILEDDFNEIDGQIDAQLTGSSVSARITAACLADTFSCVTQLQPVPVQLYTMSEVDVACLQTLLETEDNLRPIAEAARILIAILSGVSEQELFTAFLEIYLKFARNLFLSGDSEYAVKMFAFLYRRTTSAEPSEARRRQVLQALDRFWAEETLKGLCTIIDTTNVVTLDELKTLSIMIGRTSPSSLCELLGMVEKMKMRKVLLDTTTDFARERPQLLLPYLGDSRWYLVRNVVFILGQLKNTALLGKVVTLITHHELRVRKEVLKYLVTVPDPKAKPYILKFLRDESPALRIMALQMMGRARLQFALKPIAAFADTVEFEKMNISEKKAVYEAIGELGGEKMLPLFKSMLTKRYLFNKAKEKDAVICAVAGLQKIPGEETLKILEEALRSKSLEFSAVIKNAIHMAVFPKP